MNTVRLITGAVLNSFWQAVLLALLVWVVMRLLQGRINAATRHLIWWSALMVIAILPFILRHAPLVLADQPPQTKPAGLPAYVSAPVALRAEVAVITVIDEHPAVWPFWVLVIWATVFVYRVLLIVRSYVRICGVKQRAAVWMRPLPGVRRGARILVSNEVSSPIAVGFLHPAVIVPENLPQQLTVEEMNCVLLHEAAHLARFDDWVNMIACFLDAALALHPVTWWILRQIEREREIACDDWVVAQTGTALRYAESLARVAELRMVTANSVLASGVITRRSRLRERIEMLLRRGREFSPVAARLPAGAAAVAMATLAVAGALAPHWIAFAQRLEFEVASVKQNTVNGPTDFGPRRSGDLIMWHNIQPYTVIFYAYHLNGRYQLEGYVPLPEGWNWYDFDVRTPSGTTDDQVRLMFQSLLADRFKLSVHRETKDVPEFELLSGEGKAKLTPPREGEMKITIGGKTVTQPKGTCSGSVWREGTRLICHGAPMDRLANLLSSELRAPVVDRTGLTGTYDVNILYLPDERKLDADAGPARSLEQALQEELGLKLEKGKGPVEVLVIDHFEKPSEN